MFVTKSATARQIDFALLALRVSTGLTIAAHGYQKVFSIGTDKMASGFASMGIPAASLTAPFVSYLELVGGLLIAVGLLTRPVALLLLCDMFVATTFVHLKNGFFSPSGVELPLLLMVNFLALTLMGAGSYSLDHASISARSADRNV